MLKILQARLQQYISWNFQMIQLELEKAEEPETKLPTSVGSLKNQESSRKTSAAAAVAKSRQSCLTLCDPIDGSPTASSVSGILQARIRQWVAIAFSEKNIYFCFIDYAKVFDCVGHTNCGKYLKRWEYQTTLPASWEIGMQVRKQQLELDMEQQTSSK